MSNVVLVGIDVAAYSFTPLGFDGFPNQGNSLNLLGVYKKVTIRPQFSRADVTPSSQGLKEQRVTGWHWSGTLENQIRSGGALVFSTLFSGAGTNCIVSFQEEGGGGWITAIGGITDVEYARGREEGLETVNFENVGYIGGLTSSLFYSAAAVSLTSLANLFAPAGAALKTYSAAGLHA